MGNPIIALPLGNNLPVANSNRKATMTGFSHEVLLVDVGFRIIWLPDITRAHYIMAYNRLKQTPQISMSTDDSFLRMEHSSSRVGLLK